MDLKVYALLNEKIKELAGGGLTQAEVEKIVTDEVAKIVAGAPEDFDTLKEMSDWISSHEESAASMNSAIQTNANDISALDTNKVDKVAGKSLISDTEIARLAKVTNYDDSGVKADIQTNADNIDTNKTNISTLAKHVTGDLTDSDFQEDSTVAMTKTVPTGMSNYAAVKMIGGKTQKFNQILQHGDMDGSGFAAHDPSNVDVSISGGELTATIKTAEGTYKIGVKNTISFSILKNHVVIVKGDFNPSVDISMGFDIGLTRNRTNCNANVYTTVYDRFLADTNYSFLITSPGSIMPIGATYKVKNIQIFDLTAMFGAGNEPTLETFKTMFPEDYYPYTEGELWNTPVESVVSVGKNILNIAELLTDSTSWSYISLQLKPNTTYTVSSSIDNISKLSIYAFNSNGAADGNTNQVSISIPRQVTTNSDGIVKIQYKLLDSSYSFKNYTYQIEEGSEATEYSPYNKTTLLIPDSIKNLPDYGVEGNVVDFENGTYTHTNTITDGEVTALSTSEIINISDMLMPIRCESGGTITFNNEHNLDMPNTVVYKKGVSLS